MGDLAEALKNVVDRGEVVNARRRRPQHPKGWEPGVAWDGSKGVLTTSALEGEPDDWAPLLAVWGLDPQKYRVVPPVQYRAWDTNIGGGATKRLFYYRATIELRDPGDGPAIESLIKEVRRHRPVAPKNVEGDDAFLFAIADPQLGKPDGEGLTGTVRQWQDAVDRAVDRIKELRKIGRPLKRLYVANMGDIGENCAGFYPQQTFRVQLNRREQMNLARELFVATFKHLAPLFDEVYGLAVGGNHGENRNETGKSFTDFGDNDDVAVFDQVAAILSENPERYGHVKFIIPNHDLTLTLDIAGTITTFAHGHQFEGPKRIKTPGTGVGAKALNWWAGQAHGMQPAGDSTLLISAHFHHLLVTREGIKTHIQCPALESASEWYTNKTGQHSPAGALSLVINKDGWDDLKIL